MLLRVVTLLLVTHSLFTGTVKSEDTSGESFFQMIMEKLNAITADVEEVESNLQSSDTEVKHASIKFVIF